MSFTVLKRALVYALFPCQHRYGGQGISILLSCETQKVERAALKQAPKGARRVSKHVLEVPLESGRKQFGDKPSHDDGGAMGRVHWR